MLNMHMRDIWKMLENRKPLLIIQRHMMMPDIYIFHTYCTLVRINPFPTNPFVDVYGMGRGADSAHPPLISQPLKGAERLIF